MNPKIKQRIATKVDMAWYTVFTYLEDIRARIFRVDDETLHRLFSSLIDYVDGKIELQEGDIEETYVMIEQIIP